jgi:hypothetical protein
VSTIPLSRDSASKSPPSVAIVTGCSALAAWTAATADAAAPVPLDWVQPAPRSQNSDGDPITAVNAHELDIGAIRIMRVTFHRGPARSSRSRASLLRFAHCGLPMATSSVFRWSAIESRSRASLRAVVNHVVSTGKFQRKGSLT